MLGFLTPGWAINATSFTTVYAAATQSMGFDPDPWNGDILLHDFTADPATFEILSPWFARDVNYVYFGGAKIEGADPRSFVRVGERGDEWSDDRCFFQVWGSTDGWSNMTTMHICALDYTAPASDWDSICYTDYICAPPPSKSHAPERWARGIS